MTDTEDGPPQLEPTGGGLTVKTRPDPVPLPGEPISAFGYVAILIVLGVPIVGFFMAFTSVGYGENVFATLYDQYDTGRALGFVGVFIILCMYILDGFTGIKNGDMIATFKIFMLVIVCVCLGVGAVLGIDGMPQAPGWILGVTMAGCIFALERTILKGNNKKQYYEAVGACLFLAGIASFAVWGVWLTNGNEWSDCMKDTLELKLRCEESRHAVKVETAARRSLLVADGAAADFDEVVLGWKLEVARRSLQANESDSVIESCVTTTEDRYVALIEEEQAARRARRALQEGDPVPAADLGAPPSPMLSTNIEVECMAAYMMWGYPAAVGGICCMLGAMCIFLSQSLQKQKQHPAIKILIGLALIGAMALWVTASISGMEMDMTGVLLQFTFVMLGLCAFVICSAFGLDELKDRASKNRLVGQISGALKSDFAKALIVCVCFPFLVIYYLLSCANNLVRKCGCLPCTLPYVPPEEVGNSGNAFGNASDSPARPQAGSASPMSPGAGANKGKANGLGFLFSMLTPKASDHFSELLRNRTAVLVNIHWLGVILFTFFVGIGKLVVLFLSWLSGTLESQHPALVVLILVLVGVLMFCLPPVPGPPVYLCGGVVVVNALWDEDGDKYMTGEAGFWVSVVITIVICISIKLIACTCQQKGFGENLKDKIWVRQTCAVNSDLMRSIKFCLMKPGFSVAKVAILCGGPDWPTSVLCGIMGLNLFPCLLGTTPVTFLYLSQTVMAAAFQLRRGTEEDPQPMWESAANAMLGVTALSMMSTQFTAAYFVQNTMEKNKEQIDKDIPIDQEVLAADEAGKQAAAAKVTATQWGKVPCALQWGLTLSMATMIFASWCFMLRGEDCFEAFTVNDRVKTKFDGNAFNMIKPLGWLANGCFAHSCVWLHIYRTWANKAALEQVKLETPVSGISGGPVGVPESADSESGRVPPGALGA